MRQFRITDKKDVAGTSGIMLGFLGRQDQYDKFFYSKDNVIIELDDAGSTIWVIRPNGEREESITVAYAITHWVEQGLLEEITESRPPGDVAR